MKMDVTLNMLHRYLRKELDLTYKLLKAISVIHN
jgi:transposase